MRISKLAELTVDELRREESSLHEQIFRLRFQIKTGNAENPSKLGETRRDLARVKTLLRERQIGIKVGHGKAAAGRPKGRAASKEEAK
jgi:large subunit ribosomal protein L29